MSTQTSWTTVANSVSVNYRCRACNHGAACGTSYDKETNTGKVYAEIRTDPHYCVDDLVVPGQIVTVWK